MSKRRKHLKAKNIGRGGQSRVTARSSAARRARPEKAEKDFAETVAGNPFYLFAYTGILLAVAWALKLIFA